MPDLLPTDDLEPTSNADSGGRPTNYVVVARKYRPQTFEELIGQEHVTRVLQGAITSGRIGHAYLFTGARGTGKTSTARILAKALNCVQGPTPRPCNECDICQSISTGDDVDALEIDGASNNGIDQIRELRQNANIRPSRARFKIYIIDEVHMLSTAAFNGLLKTLEEPPEHVKFIFCTTEVQKIPDTILSRCQRFDFAGVEMGQIAQRLAQIAEKENVEAEPEALLLLARRAAGSMRDSQSLLEQLLSFGNQKITVVDVHEMLGTAGAAQLSQVVQHLVERDTAAALAELDAAVREGVDVSQLLDQLLGYYRDLMVTVAGCPSTALIYSSPGEHAKLLGMGRRLGMETILAMIQIVDQTLGRLRYSMHPRALAELAFVRICTLADLESLPALIGQLRSDAAQSTAAAGGMTARAAGGSAAGTPTTPAKKKWLETGSRATLPLHQPVESNGGTEASAHRSGQSPGRSLTPQSVPSPSVPAPSVPAPSPEELEGAWEAALETVGGLLAEYARNATLSLRDTAQLTGQATGAPNQVVASFAPQYNFGKQFCERPENLAQLEQAYGESLGRDVRLLMAIRSTATSVPASPIERRKPTGTALGKSEKTEHPWVKRATELFDARLVWMEEPHAEAEVVAAVSPPRRAESKDVG